MRGIGPPFFDARILVAHHIGPERAFSTVATPAVDANPAEHHRRPFGPKSWCVRFGGGGPGGAPHAGAWFAGSRAVAAPPPQQICEEGFGGWFRARRRPGPDGKRRASSLQALRLGRG